MGLHPVKIKLLKHVGCLCAPLSFHQEAQVSISALSQSSADLGTVYAAALSFLSENFFSQREAKKGNEKEKKRERKKTRKQNSSSLTNKSRPVDCLCLVLFKKFLYPCKPTRFDHVGLL